MKLIYKSYKFLVIACYLICGCSPVPESVKRTDTPVVIYPDYKDIAIPYNIAPLNFLIRTQDADAVAVIVKSNNDSICVNSYGNKVIFPLDNWKSFLVKQKGKRLNISVTARINKKWFAFPVFTWLVTNEPIDSYISYRLIEPGYEVWNDIKIKERCIENFDEKMIADNSQYEGKCMNCHIHGGPDNKSSFFYIRGKDGGTILNRNGKLSKITLKNDKMISAAVYGDLNPKGRYGVFSTNIIIPSFHSTNNKRMEVYDTKSDLAIADFDNERMIISPLVADSSIFETFPTFSADGKYVYYCGAKRVKLPQDVKKLKYSLCRIEFDFKNGKWGNKIDTVWNASIMNGSVCHPKASPNGKYILYTVSQYGTFPLWHKEANLQLMNLKNGTIDSLKAVNSNRSDTYHSWSSNSHWFAFASKRYDGQYGRIFFAYIDNNGKCYKPFSLPQKDPENDDLNLKSYNIPDLSKTSVPYDSKMIQRINERQIAHTFK